MVLELRWVEEDTTTDCDVVKYRTEANINEVEKDINALLENPNVKKIQLITTETVYERGKE